MALLCLLPIFGFSQKKKTSTPVQVPEPAFQADRFSALTFRNIGPFRGGRSVAAVGVPGNPQTYYFGGTGGGVWKTDDAGITWRNISDGFFKSGSVGAIAIAPSDPNVIFVGMGEHAVRGVMTSHGDGMYKSTDAGKSWKHIGLPNSRHIAAVRIHPTNPDLVFVAVQGALFGPGEDRGVYKSTDGGKTWSKVLYVDASTGAADLSMDPSNPRILYAGMWDHQRTPWQVRSGGKGSGIWKSSDGGETWEQLKNGLPKEMGKIAVDVSPANPQRVYANIEAEKGGVFRSDDGGKTWQQVNSQRITVARAWYYIEIFADPNNANVVYVLNAPMLKSIDGGRTFQSIPNPHVDQHDMWINPANSQNIILANDGGACITFNGGKTWSTQGNQPTAQFYRVITDRRFPYHLYAGQQDNSSMAIASRTIGGGIGESEWYPAAGCESAFLAFDPDDPKLVYGTCIQGGIDVYDHATEMVKDIMQYPQVNLGTSPKDQKYRFNWNNPIVAQPQNPKIMYHGANVLFRTDNGGYTWTTISPDLTRNDTTKHGWGGVPYTNEAAGAEVYNTISYITCSPQQAGVIWVGTDDGLVHFTRDEGKSWKNVTPPGLPESLINAIEVSTHDPGTAYIAVTRYKFDDLKPMIFVTSDYGATWKSIINGLPSDNFVRVVREDPKARGLLYAGTEHGLYISFNAGEKWQRFQSNLPTCPITDLTFADNDLVVATSGRAFWILDDLGALQQSLGKPDTVALKLFTPKDTYKFTLFSPPQPSPYQGQNPRAGVIFDYYLPHHFSDTTELKLEVIDASGNVVRTFSNQKPKDFKSWPGGPQPPQVLPSKPGLNRFSWDLQREQLPAVEGIFVMGDYSGHYAAPGIYKLRMSTANSFSEVSVRVLPDPRLNASHSDFEEQQTLLMKIETAVKDLNQSVTQLRNVKGQLENRLSLLKKMEGQKSLVELGEKATKSIVKWEEQLIQPKQETFQDVINFPNRLNSEFLNMKTTIDTYAPKPTDGAKSRLNDILALWEKGKKEMNRIIADEVAEFNKAYAAAALPALILPER